jgi:hypothetical protein
MRINGAWDSESLGIASAGHIENAELGVGNERLPSLRAEPQYGSVRILAVADTDSGRNNCDFDAVVAAVAVAATAFVPAGGCELSRQNAHLLSFAQGLAG